MENMEIGEYVRTDNGEILKVLDTEKGSVKAKSLNCKEWFGLCGITKHSKNIIDLIEVGDIVLVEDLKVDNLLYKSEINMDRTILDLRMCIKDKLVKIKEILTHEQYENNCYKLVE